MADNRKQMAYDSKQPLKNPDVYSYVLEHLREGWSPEGISGRLRNKTIKGIPTGRYVMKQFINLSTKKKQIKQNRDKWMRWMVDVKRKRHLQQ